MRAAERTASGSSEALGSSEASSPRILTLTSKSSTGSSSGSSTASDHDMTRSIEVRYVPEMTESIYHSQAELKGLVKALTAELRHHQGLLKQTQAQNEQFNKLLKDVQSNEDLKRNEFRAQMRCQQETVTDLHLNVLKTTKDVREFAVMQFNRTEEMANRVEELTKTVCALRDSIPQQVHTGIKDIKDTLSVLQSDFNHDLKVLQGTMQVDIQNATDYMVTVTNRRQTEELEQRLREERDESERLRRVDRDQLNLRFQH